MNVYIISLLNNVDTRAEYLLQRFEILKQNKRVRKYKKMILCSYHCNCSTKCILPGITDVLDICEDFLDNYDSEENNDENNEFEDNYDDKFY